MNPELEKLIDLALADSVLTDKERAVLQKKAESLGVDQDEFEMILEGKLHLAQKAAAPPPPTADEKPSSNKEGELKKCPSCGAPVSSFATKCEHCGHEFRNIESARSVKDLVTKLEEAEEKARNTKSGGGLLNSYMKMFDGDTELEKRIFNAKSNVISSFPVPNTKEDILEFLALSVAQVNSIKIGALIRMAGTSGTYGYKVTYRNAWLSIANKVVLKARFSMKEDKKTLEEIEYYAKQLNIK